MIQAVICDVYGTLLEVGPPPPDAEARWTTLWHARIGSEDAPTLASLDDAVRQRIPAAHAAGRARGLIQPEVDWPALAAASFPALHQLTATERTSFFYEHARLLRSTRLAPDAADCLRALRAAGIIIGIASNAQPCTRLELADSLTATGLNTDICDESVSYFSCEHGVAKPDPHVFATLRDRLAARGIAPEATLMVGDRLDNDIAPATAAGWQTWHLQAIPGPSAGPWRALLAALLRPSGALTIGNR